MVLSPEYAGKWVATIEGRIIGASYNLRELTRRIEKRKDRSDIRYTQVPKVMVTA